MKSDCHLAASIHLADLLDPALHTHEDIDGAAVTLNPIEEAAFEVVLDVAARITEAGGWDALAGRSLEPEFGPTFAALCRAQANEARRIKGGRRG